MSWMGKRGLGGESPHWRRRRTRTGGLGATGGPGGTSPPRPVRPCLLQAWRLLRHRLSGPRPNHAQSLQVSTVQYSRQFGIFFETEIEEILTQINVETELFGQLVNQHVHQRQFVATLTRLCDVEIMRYAHVLLLLEP